MIWLKFAAIQLMFRTSHWLYPALVVVAVMAAIAFASGCSSHFVTPSDCEARGGVYLYREGVCLKREAVLE